MALDDIETIVIVMMENRSFDHALGYLSLDETPHRLPVDGLRSDPRWQRAHSNEFRGEPYRPRPLAASSRIVDPPHKQAAISRQIDTLPVGPGPTVMGGFVESYALDSHKPPAPENYGDVMGYYTAPDLPTFDFFARHYCLCDHWFAALPLGTQANRLMAMAGESKIVDNVNFPLPVHRLIYDWLSDRGVNWCVYQWGGFLPFFALMLPWLGEIVASLTFSELGLGAGHFRRYSRLRREWRSRKPMPSVIFVEPEYSDGPHLKPNDDHPPTRMDRGQTMLLDLYRTLTSNPSRWAKTLLVVTYDEHGGFFDHVPPLAIDTTAGEILFERSGVRVPAFLISPQVAAGTVFNEPLDHTSILQLLDDRFADGHGYSPAVAERSARLGRIAKALEDEPRKGPVPAFPWTVRSRLDAAVGMLARLLETIMGRRFSALAIPSAPDTTNSRALDEALRRAARDYPDLLSQPGWEEARAYLALNDRPEPEREIVPS